MIIDLENLDKRLKQVEDRINYFNNLIKNYATTFDLLDQRIEDLKRRVETLETKQ
jgi:DNA repair ATPase RecN